MQTTHSFKRTERLNDQLRENISTLLLRDVKEPRVEGVTITRVVAEEDLQTAKVYYRILNTSSDEVKKIDETQFGLEKVSGFIRHSLGKALHIKRIPHFKFVYDGELEKQQRMQQLFMQVEQELKAVKAPSDDSGTSQA